jgi:hypothetical protein
MVWQLPYDSASGASGGAAPDDPGRTQLRADAPVAVAMNLPPEVPVIACVDVIEKAAACARHSGDRCGPFDLVFGGGTRLGVFVDTLVSSLMISEPFGPGPAWLL